MLDNVIQHDSLCTLLLNNEYKITFNIIFGSDWFSVREKPLVKIVKYFTILLSYS
jgi:hypothetical protein